MLFGLVLFALSVAAPAQSSPVPIPDRQFGPWVLHEEKSPPKPSITPQTRGVETLSVHLKEGAGTVSFVADSFSFSANVRLQDGKTTYFGTINLDHFPPQGEEASVPERVVQYLQSTPSNVLPAAERDAVVTELSSSEKNLVQAIAVMRADSVSLLGGIHPLSCSPPNCFY